MMRLAIALSLLASACWAGPINSATSQCAKYCDASSSGFQVGNKYNYDYSSVISTHIDGTTENQSSLKVKATATFEAISECDLLLTLSNIKLKDADPANPSSWASVPMEGSFANALQANALRFAYSEGQINDVCPEETEEDWVLNIKRGVISLLLTSPHNVDITTKTVEFDVTGECDVRYSVKTTSNGRTVSKSKEPLSCKQRSGYESITQSIPYFAPSKIQSSPVLKSTHECVQELKNDNMLQSSSCEEKHQLRPFSNGDSGAVTEVTSTLTFKNKGSGSSSDKTGIRRRTNILFKHGTSSMTHATEFNAEIILGDLCSAASEEASTTAPGLFIKLVDSMKKLDFDQLKELHTNAVSRCSKGVKFVEDALISVDTSAGVKLAMDLIASSDPDAASMWLTSIAFIENPTKEMISVLKPLLSGKLNPKAYLAVSSLIHNYCHYHAECATESVINEVFDILVENLRFNCEAENVEQHHKIIASLKAIGNIGHLENFLSKLGHCITNKNAKTDIRVAALQAHRRMPCSSDWPEVKQIIEDQTEDPELRINAYLGAVHCASPSLLQAAANVLVNEKSNQVGSFIWTHLTNLAETSSPLKQSIRRVLEDIELQKEFDLDSRKFSRNLEWSRFSDYLNAGASLDGNLIFSDKSFIPRSASVNVTMDLFGQSTNILDIGVRAQGLDPVLEQFLEGKSADNILNRNKRGLISKAHVEAFDDDFKADRDDELQGSYYIRIFGNEIRYKDFHGIGNMGNMLTEYQKVFAKIMGTESVDYSKGTMFVDRSVIYPTIAGMPLEMHLEGAAVTKISLSGKMDYTKLMATNPELDLALNVKPSASVEMRGSMTVCAHVANSGITHNVNLYTSTGAEGSISLKNGNDFQFKMAPPKDLNPETFGQIKSTFSLHHRNNLIDPTIPNVEFTEINYCTDESVATITGLKLCFDSSIPIQSYSHTPYFPLTGPANVRLTLHQNDIPNGYLFKTTLKKANDVIPLEELMFQIDTPGSTVDRKLQVSYDLDRATNTLKLGVLSPWKKADITGTLLNTDAMKRTTVNAKIDDTAEYDILAEVGITQKTHVTEYAPKFTFSMPGQSPKIVSGTIIWRPMKKADVTLELVYAPGTKAKIEGDINLINNKKDGRKRFDTSMELTLPSGASSISFFAEKVTKENVVYATKLEVGYTAPKQPKNSIILSGKVMDKSDTTKHDYEFKLSTSMSAFPDFDTQVVMKAYQDPRKIKASFETGLSNFDTPVALVEIQGSTLSQKGTIYYDGKAKVDVPSAHINYSSSFDHWHSKDQMHNSLFVRYGPGKILQAELEASGLESIYTKPTSVQGSGMLSFPGHRYSFTESLQQTEDYKFVHSFVVNCKDDKIIDMEQTLIAWPRYEITSTLNTIYTEPINVQGHLTPNLRKLESLASVSYGKAEYSIEMNNVFTNTKKGYKVQGNADLKYPGRWISGTSSIIRKNDELNTNGEIKWDAGNDDTKRVSLFSSVALSTTKPAFQLKTQYWPNQFIDVTGTFEYDEQGWWHPRRDLAGTLAFKTSYSGYEQFGFSFVHDQTPETMTSHGRLTLRPGEEIIGNVTSQIGGGWRDFSSSVLIHTMMSSSPVRNIQYDMDFKLLDKEMKTSHQVEYDGQQVAVDLSTSWDVANQNLGGLLGIRTPFEGYEDMQFNLKHLFSADNMHTEITAGRVQGHKYSLLFKMNKARDGWFLDTDGALQFIIDYASGSPYKAILNWDHVNNLEELNSDFSLDINGIVTQFQLGGNAQLADTQNIRVKGSGTVKIPLGILQIEGVPDINSLFEFSHFRNGIKAFNTNITIQGSPENIYGFKHRWSNENPDMSDVSYTSEITTPFTGFETIENTMVYKRQNKVINFNIVSKRSNGDSYTLNMDYDYTQAPLHSYVIRITTPHPGYERITLEESTIMDGDIQVQTTKLTYGKHSYQRIIKVGWLSRKMFSIDITSDLPYTKKIYFLAEATGENKKAGLTMKIEYPELMPEPIVASLTYDVLDLSKYEAVLAITTPFEAAATIDARYHHSLRNSNNYYAEVTFGIPNYDFKAEAEGIYYSSKSMYGSIKIEYEPGKLIDFDMSYSNEENTKASVNLKTPFESVSDVGAAFLYEGVPTDFKTELTIKIAPEQNIHSVLTFQKAQNDLTTSWTVTTPYTGYESNNLNFEHHGGWTDFENSLRMQVGGKAYSAGTTFTLRENTLSLTIPIHTPYEILSDLEIKVDHAGPATNFDNSIVVTYNTDKTITLSSLYHTSDKGRKAELKLTSPYDVVKSFIIQFEHNGKWTDFKNSGSINYNGQMMYSASSNFMMNDLTSQMGINVEAQTGDLITFMYKGNLANFESMAELSYAGQRYSMQSHYSRSESDISASTVLKIPETYQFNFTHHTDATELSGSLLLTSPMVTLINTKYGLHNGEFRDGHVEVNVPKAWLASRTKRSTGSEKVGVSLDLKSKVGSTSQREISIGADLGQPESQADLTYSYTYTPGSQYKSDSSLNYNSKTWAHQLEVNKQTRGDKDIYDGSLSLTGPTIGTVTPTFSHTAAPQLYTTVINLPNGKITNKATLREPGMRDFDIDFSINHDELNQPIQVTTTGIIKPETPIIDGSIKVMAGGQKMEFTGRVADDSPSPNDIKYLARMQLLHPASKMEFYHDIVYVNNRLTAGVTSEGRYMMADGTNKKANFKAEVEKNREQFNFEMTSPWTICQVTVNRMELPRSCQHDIFAKLDDMTLNGNLEVIHQKGFDLTLKNQDGHTLHTHARLLSPTLAQFEIYRDLESGARVQDAVLAFNLNTTRLVHTRIHMRPELPNDFVKAHQIVSDYTKEKEQKMTADIGREWSSRAQAIYQAAAPWRELGQVVSGKLQPVTDTFSQMYDANTMYIKDMAQWSQARNADFQAAVNQWAADMSSEYEQTSRTLQRQRMITSDSLNQYGQTAWSYFQSGLSYLEEKYQEAPNMGQVADDATNWIIEQVDDGIDSIINHPTVVSITEYIKDFENNNYAYNKLKIKSKDGWNSFVSHPYVKPVYDFVATNVFQYFDLDDLENKVRTGISDLRANGPIRIFSIISNGTKEYFQLEKTQITVYQPDNYEYQFETYLPINLYDWEEVARIDRSIRRWWNRMHDSLTTLLPEDGWSFWDNYYKYKPSEDMYDWIPPFRGHAAMSGNQHIMTFDKKFYAFAGDCSYLLARDHIDGTFSVVVNYNDGIKKSISVLSGNNQVEIMPAFKILVDGSQAELPMSLGKHTYIRRIGSSVQIDNTNGVSVICDLVHDRCTVNVTGWYFGKTGGLLGTYDNEHHNDHFSPEGEIVESVPHFANSWTVGRKCSIVNKATIDPPYNAKHESMCSKYFTEESSPYRICFKQVSNQAFHQMCLNELSTKSSPTQQDVCNIAAFYVDECNRHGVPISMSRDCLTCQKPDNQPFLGGASIKLDGDDVPMSADVIIVLSKASCNEAVAPRISDVIGQLDKNLKLKGLTDNRFGLVGYGGRGLLSMPHSHTLDGELFGNRQRFQDIARAVNIDSKTSGEEDSLNAIKYAAQYPFRAGVSKSIIIVPCGKCMEYGVDYSELQAILLDRDIKLMSLMQHDFDLIKNNKKKTDIIYGSNANGLFTSKHVGEKTIEADDSLLSLVQTPKDYCVALTEETGGTTFSSNHLIESDSTLRKKFLDVMTRVSADSFQPTDCQLCDCIPEKETGVGIARCRACVMKSPLYFFPPDFEIEGSFGFEDEALNPNDRPFKKGRGN